MTQVRNPTYGPALTAILIIPGIFAGCLEDSPPASPEPDEQGDASLVAIEFPEAARSVEVTWATLEFNASGGPGTWLVVSHPVPDPGPEGFLRIDLSVGSSSEAGVPLGLLVTPPWFSEDWLRDDRGESLDFGTDARLILRPSGGSASFDLTNYTIGILCGTSTGEPCPVTFPNIIFLIGSTGAWNVQLRVALMERDGERFVDRQGPATRPQRIATGDGVQLFQGQSATDDAGVHGRLQLAADRSASGWSHLEIYDDSGHPIGAREYDIRTPDDYRFEDQQQRVGVETPGPIVGLGAPACPGFGDWMLTRLGVPYGNAGRFEASVERMETGGRWDIFLAHVPGAEKGLPDGFQLGAVYQDNSHPCTGNPMSLVMGDDTRSETLSTGLPVPRTQS